jgi:hypothetical protein
MSFFCDPRLDAVLDSYLRQHTQQQFRSNYMNCLYSPDTPRMRGILSKRMRSRCGERKRGDGAGPVSQ